jgi:hypothetical protein
MPRIANCKTDIEYGGPSAHEFKVVAVPDNWTKEKSVAFEAVVQSLRKDGYRNFTSSVKTIGLQRKGESAIYRVPVGQRGSLAAYAGKYVHIVCVDRTDDYSGRIFAVSEVSETGQPIKKKMSK